MILVQQINVENVATPTFPADFDKLEVQGSDIIFLSCLIEVC